MSTPINGRTWEWEHYGVTYKAVSLNGSPVVHLHYRSTGDVNWQDGPSRATNGRSAHAIARELYGIVGGIYRPIVWRERTY